tara:strand:- start:719 stop:1342 length:624 start_codon:yes stop_codon:yes gene_type:complete
MSKTVITAESMNLADTYAFTGTVTGTNTAVQLLSTVTISGTSTTNIDFNGLFSSDYDHYKIYIDRCTPITGDAKLYLRFFTAAGIITSSSYVHLAAGSTRNISSDASGNSYNAGEGTAMILNGAGGSNNDDTYSMNYEFTLRDPLNTTSYKQIKMSNSVISENATEYWTNTGTGFYQATTALTGVRFYWSGGNWAVPSVARLYGVIK